MKVSLLGRSLLVLMIVLLMVSESEGGWWWRRRRSITSSSREKRSAENYFDFGDEEFNAEINAEINEARDATFRQKREYKEVDESLNEET